ncbi:MAG: hypothetical protein ACPLSN_03595 [Dictyoglomus turgidum]
MSITESYLLFQRFFFTKPIIIEDLPTGSKDEIVALPDKTIVRLSPESEEKDMAEILSAVKLAETDPLLVTFFYQKDLSKQESVYATMFYLLCEPLKNAWVYGIMRHYIPDVYEKEIQELLNMWDLITGGKPVVDSDPKIIQQALGIWAVISENPANKVELKLTYRGAPEGRRQWDRYLSAIAEFSRQKPSVDLYIKLAEISEAPYQVKVIVEEGIRVFEVRKRT